MRLVLTADWHIKLGQKNVPKEWQKGRYRQLFKQLNDIDFDVLVIAGDIFDVPKPSLEEVGLFIEFLSSNTYLHTYIITGNHEMSGKTESTLDNLSSLCADYDAQLITEPSTIEGIDFLPYNFLKTFSKDQSTLKKQSNILVTHVRGAIEPHVVPEVPLSIFSEYDKVLTGDLHHYHEQENLLYPGSPLTTSFVRSDDIAKGVVVFDTETLTHEFINLGLPQLRRSIVDKPNDMVQTEPDHTIYELESDAVTIKTVANSDLLDKKITMTTKQEATLDLNGYSIEEELQLYLAEILTLEDSRVTELLTSYDTERP